MSKIFNVILNSRALNQPEDLFFPTTAHSLIIIHSLSVRFNTQALLLTTMFKSTERQRQGESAGLLNVTSRWGRGVKEGNFPLVCIRVLKTEEICIHLHCLERIEAKNVCVLKTRCTKVQNLTCVYFVPKLAILCILRAFCIVFISGGLFLNKCLT